MGDRDATRVRLLPWTGAHGQPCLLLADGGGDGSVSRLADRIENGRLGLAERLLSRARDVLAGSGGKRDGELGSLAAQLCDALADALLIARSRGARLGGTRVAPPSADGIPGVHEALVCASPVEPRAFGLLSLSGADFASAGVARRYVRATARWWGLAPDAVDDLETITGELTANALEHSDSHVITVSVALTAAAATVSVTDAGTGRRAVAQSRPPGPAQEHGRGLLITEALATGWGQRWTGDGLTVWAELATRSQRVNSES
ncbi:ATP-binding protein [Streptomyces sp. NBC_00104]|uniref:ATP-binding protein n=1 Tax=unclassified Streptomyces TaxID=2593676 RepID=UPI002E1DC9F1